MSRLRFMIPATHLVTRQTLTFGVCRSVMAVVILATCTEAAFQIDSEEQHQLDTERTVIHAVQSLRQHLREDDEQAARNELRRLERTSPQSLIPGEDAIHGPVFRVQMELLHAADSRFRERLRQEQRPAAEAAFRAAVVDGSPNQLLEVVQRYPCSDAAYRALQLISRMQIERGHLLAAVWWLQPVAHRNVPLQFRDASRAALDQLLADIRGRAADQHNESAVSQRVPQPPSSAWSWKISTSPELKPGLARIIEGAVEAHVVPWTAWHPELRDDSVYIRTLRGVDAVSLSTGQAQWNYRLSGSLMPGLEVPRRLLDREGEPKILFRQLDISTITNRFFRDAVTGCLSTDEHRVYVVNTADPHHQTAAVPSRPTSSARRTAAVNELVALDRHSGRPAWVIGGPPVEAMFGNELANAWIFGTPAVHGSLLYCVVEQDDAIALVCLQSETGRVLWRKFLAFPPAAISQDIVRQYLSATPTVQDGLAWVRTTTGWTVAVDTLTQMTLWAARTSDAAATESSLPGARRRGIRTVSSSLSQSWRPDTLKVAGDVLIVCPHLQHQLRVLDALTGQVRMQRASEGQVLLLSIDPGKDSVILGGPNGVVAWSLQTGTAIWSTRLPNAVFPVGMGARDGQNLILPLSNGRLATINVATGSIVHITRDVVMPHPSGGVLTVGEDLLTYGPFGLQRLSDASESETLPTVATIQELIDTEEFESALSQLPFVRETVLNRRELTATRFRCLAQLFQPGSANAVQQLGELREDASTAADRAVVLSLEVEQLLATGDSTAAARRLVEAVELPDTVLSSLTSDSVRRLAAKQEFPQPQTNASFEIALRTRIGELIRKLALTDDDARDVIAEAAAGWEDRQFLTYCGDAFPDGLLQRAEARISRGVVDDLTLRLILGVQSRHRSSTAPTDISTPMTDRAAQLWHAASAHARESLPQPELVESLISALAREADLSQKPPEESADDSSIESGPRHRQLVQFWKDWATTEFRMIPISQSTSFRRANPALSLVDSSDPFLNSYSWRLHRSMPMLMINDPLGDNEAPWIIQGGNADTFQSESGEELLRIGGVVLLMSQQTLTAVSIVEQRVLWSRTYATRYSEQPAFRLATARLFKDFAREFRRSWLYTNRGFRICGFDQNHLCIQSSAGLEVLDLGTGWLDWKLSRTELAETAFATQSAVHPSLAFATAGVALHLADGRMMRSALAPDDLRNTITTFADQVVVWRTGDGPEDDVELVWIDGADGAETQRVRLAGAESFQFLDQCTLAAVSEEERLQTVNLKSGSSQTISFDDPDSSSVAEAPDDDRPPDGPQRPRDFPRWSPERVLIFRDAQHYYAVNRRDAASPQMPHVTGHHLTEVEGQLRAFDRVSGELKWTYDIPDTAAVTFDRPLMPMLMLIRMRRGERGPAALVQQLHQLSFQALAKSTGDLKFEHRTSSRHPVPVLQIDVHPNKVVDVEAFGSRVRFVPQ